MSEEQPSPEAMEAARPFVSVDRTEGRYLITVGEDIVDDPIYELYNTEESANRTALNLVSAFASAMDRFATTAVQTRLVQIAGELEAQVEYSQTLQRDGHEFAADHEAAFRSALQIVRKA